MHRIREISIMDKIYLEDTFIESPIYDNWFKKFNPQKSLLICSPYIKKEALDRLISLYNLDEKDNDFELKILMRGNTNEFTYQKSSDLSVFNSLLAIKDFDINNVRRVTNLHMKAYLIDGTYLLITSGNLTNSGMFVLSRKENFEGGISTRDPGIVMSFLKYFSKIWQQSESLNDFYDDLISAYEKYIKEDYSDKQTLQRLNKRKYKFTSYTTVEMGIDNKKRTKNDDNNEYEPTLETLLNHKDDNSSYDFEIQEFSLNDIPPVGKFEHVPVVLKILSEHPDGLTYIELGRLLRSHFTDNISTTAGTNRKFGEEKGKFASFFDLVNIEKTNHGNLIKISRLGKTYLSLNDDAKHKLIKDIFFNKPLIVSIMRQSLETKDFDLKVFLNKKCKGATATTLSRKVSPLKELFNYISSICTEDELKTALEIK